MARLKNEAYTQAFSKHLRELRENKKMTLQDLGIASNLDLATIHRIETTHGNVTLITILALAKGLKVHPTELLSFNHKQFL
jgi:transcriptional regulator with XRE-family HTH domain